MQRRRIRIIRRRPLEPDTKREPSPGEDQEERDQRNQQTYRRLQAGFPIRRKAADETEED